MLNKIDKFLNKITMYKLVLYYLMILWGIAFTFSIFGWLHFSPIHMLISLGILFVSSWITNKVFAYVFHVPANVESIYITVFILALVISPALNTLGYLFLMWAGILAMASKYIFAIKHKHIFNPAAFSLVVTAFFLNQAANWWIGTIIMFPFVLAGGLMIVRKIKRSDLTISYFLVALVTILSLSFLRGGNLFITLSKALFYSPLFFFTFIMITEPLTTPPSRFLRILYGGLVGFLFAPGVHIASLYFSPELALIFGNMFSYLISPKKRLTLKLKEAIQVTPDTAEFVFKPDSPIHFRPGQYLEWTLACKENDSRGNRRYFTIASSPTEKDLRIGIKFYPNPSTFKKSLAYMKNTDTIIASQLSGDFVLPKNKRKKLVLIAGGIGITPFRSMIKYLIDKKETRDIVLFYSNKKESDIVYKDIFDEAKEKINLKVVYTLTDKEETNWAGHTGFVDTNMIKEEVSDYLDRTFYVSGPPSMVSGISKTIKNLGVKNHKIKTDYFPGFA